MFIPATWPSIEGCIDVDLSIEWTLGVVMYLTGWAGTECREKKIKFIMKTLVTFAHIKLLGRDISSWRCEA